MATFQKRGKKWRAIVRKAGHRPLSKTFDTKGSAARWAREQERDIDSAAFTDPKVLQQITVGSLIDRFLEEFEPRRAKKGSLGILKTGLGHLHLTDLTPMDTLLLRFNYNWEELYLLLFFVWHKGRYVTFRAAFSSGNRNRALTPPRFIGIFPPLSCSGRGMNCKVFYILKI